MSCQVAGDSKEAVAYGLLLTILHAQGRANQDHPFVAGSTMLRGQPACSETEILALYARCLRVVQGQDPAVVSPAVVSAEKKADKPVQAVPPPAASLHS